MAPRLRLLNTCGHCRPRHLHPRTSARYLTIDHRNRLSNFFAPSGGIAETKDDQEDIHSLLVRAGYLRQAHSGIFHYLPLGLRVHEKLERLIDKHMRSLGASKLALSTISTEKLWAKTGRLDKGGSELFRFKDRKGGRYLLAPTHEEEITSLVASLVGSHKQLPLRVYQIGRKYRDERRPRAGLLRGREFTMKDLYTFDGTEAEALETYADVQVAYKALFDELKLPYLVAEADSGTMGGSLSHEYLYPSSTGEDTIISCNSCAYSSNLEAAVPRPSEHPSATTPSATAVHHSITHDRKTLVNTYYLQSPSGSSLEPNEVNLHRIKALVPDLDPSVTPSSVSPGTSSSPALEYFMEHFTAYSSEGPASQPGGYSQIINLFDGALPHSQTESSFSNHSDHPTTAALHFFIADKRIPTASVSSDPHTGAPLVLLKVRTGDRCPRCDTGTLHSTTAIEVAHTFHLGTRYTDPLSAAVFDASQKRVPMHQGCHGIGLSRLIPALAQGYRESVDATTGLAWPRVIAPWEVAVLAYPGASRDAEEVYDVLVGEDGVDDDDAKTGERVEAVVDDRDRDLVWKMKDADLVGYPVFCVLGRAWKRERRIEVQSRRAGAKVEVPLEKLRGVVEDLLKEL